METKKSNAGRKKLYGEATTVLSIVVPVSAKKYIKSVVETMLIPLRK